MLSERIALVTGGGRGIGAAIATAFARTGARLVITGRSASSLDEQLRLLRAEQPEGTDPARVLAVTADVSKPTDVDRLFARIHEEYGPLDVLVANAGVQGPIGPLEDAEPEDFAAAIAVNLTGTWLCMRAAIADMKLRRAGKIITLSGGGATGPRPRFAAYAASKVAVVRLTETAADELRAWNIDVNAIAPGAVNTAMLDDVLAAGARAGEEFAAAERRARDGGTPPDRAAELAVFLASSHSDGITGKLLSAVWDPWQDDAFAARLRAEADFCTLRRIDGKNFGPIG